VAEVDTETGQVRLRDYVAVDDVGTVINPMIVDGQIHGGVVQGIGEALYEEVVYDTDGNPLTASLSDYGVPSAIDVPPIRTARIITPSPATPLGAKGAGETGATGSMPAVINAVIDALRPLAVTTIDLPATPQRVWQLVRSAHEGSIRESDPLPTWGPAAVEAAGSSESTPIV
jgi:carbon-monoxide dehydrogenase large subunit